jgi:lysophospholipase L1-like esterase
MSRVTIILSVVSIVLGGWIGQGSAAEVTPHYYVAVGGSLSVGFQPTPNAVSGEPTDDGYANDLVTLESSRWPDLQVVHTGCPGETTQTMLQGGDRCYAAPNSQIQAVVTFLRDNPGSTVLVTVDLGFNDVSRCLIHETVDSACVSRALDRIRLQLPEILRDIQAVTPADTEIIGLNHYDPYLADDRGDQHDQLFALRSVGIVDQLNDLLDQVYTQRGIELANVQAAFDHFGGETSVSDPGADQMCDITWMCASPPLGPNPHPNDLGYRIIASAIASVVSRNP